MNWRLISRRGFLKLSCMTAAGIVFGKSSLNLLPIESKEALNNMNNEIMKEPKRSSNINYTNMGKEILECRMIHASFLHPQWKRRAENWDETKEKMWRNFWDKNYWNETLTEWSKEGYNAIYWRHRPWHMWRPWQTFLIRLEEFPEARELTSEETERIIEHMSWLFHRAKELGMRNFMVTILIHYTGAFAKAHGLDKEMPVSETVAPHHNIKSVGGHDCGVRNELTRAFTEAAIAELFQTYKDLDGLFLDLGEALPGERSTYFKEAIVPGIRRSGRKPIMMVMNWQIPLESYMKNIAPKEVYENTWLAIHGYNMECITDAKPYPYVVEWAERVGLPTVLTICPENMKLFPFNSPRFAYEIIREMKKVENVIGFFTFNSFEKGTRQLPPHNPLFRKALAYYAGSIEPYSEEPWINLLEERYGDREAAKHFLKAYDVSAHIIPETLALIWFPGDITSLELRLPYEFMRGNFPFRDAPRLNKTSPARGIYLIPVEDYVRIVAEKPKFVDNNGSDPSKWPFFQTHIWDYGTFDVTPPAQMRKVRAMGEECFREAEKALKTVKKNREEAIREFNFMKAYMLMSRYYEKKVLAAISAWVYAKAGRTKDKEKAERLADEALEAYLEAANFMLDNLNKAVVELTGSQIGVAVYPQQSLPTLIEDEKKDREKLAEIFRWSQQGD